MNPHPLTGYTHIMYALLALILVTLAGCGKTGPLYLPDAASEVVTRPVATPAGTESTTTPGSPQTPDSQPAAPAPAAEVTVPNSTKPESKKEKGAQPPPHL